MNGDPSVATTPELHHRIRQAWHDLQQARLDPDPTRSPAAEHTLNHLLDALSYRVALNDAQQLAGGPSNRPM